MISWSGCRVNVCINRGRLAPCGLYLSFHNFTLYSWAELSDSHFNCKIELQDIFDISKIIKKIIYLAKIEN